MLKNLVGIVTGGASGLGKAAATKLAEEGCNIIICDLPQSSGMEVARSLLPFSSKTCFTPADIRDPDSVDTMFQEVIRKFERVDFVVNCAGIASAHKTYNYNSSKFFNITRFRRVFETNVIGTFNVVRHAAKYIGENEPDEDGLRGTIINLSGIEGFEGQMGQVAIAGTSGSIASMTLPLARDLSSRGIRVLCVCAGVFDTPLTSGMPGKVVHHISSECLGPKRFGKPEEFGDAIKFLLQNRYMNATVLRIDGGLRLFYG